MVQYTQEEKLDMILVYGECRKNSVEAKRVYQQRYPDRKQPSRINFSDLCKNLRRYGAFVKPKRDRKKRTRTDANTALVIQEVNQNPKISLQTIEEVTGVSRSSSSRILSENSYHPYKGKLVHKLHPGDPERRMDFLAIFSNLLEQDQNVLSKILWSDECRFNNNGVVNRHNCHYWSQNNPHWIIEKENQRLFGINVWCGILNGYILGPYFYDGNLNGPRYLNFLQTTLPELLEEVPIQIRQDLWLQQDGAPAHNSQTVIDFLNYHYPDKWIGTYGPIQWPARSPDLSPLDYFLWGHLKDVVYEEPIEDMADLVNKIQASCAAISRRTILDATTRKLLRNFDACVREEGRNFEQFV